jgi:branched-chain amino acid transport system substrate-binding protein
MTTPQRWWAAGVAILLFAGAVVWNRWKYAEQGEIVLGAVFDLTGSLSYMGQWSLEGAKIAEEEINADGGLYGKTLRLAIEDAETSPKTAVTAFQRLRSTYHVQIVIGFNGSSEVMAVAPLAERERVVLLSTGAASPDITTAGDYVFRNRLSGAVETARIAELAFANLSLRRGAILFINTDYGKGYAEAFRARFTGMGGEIAVAEGFAQDQSDFKPHLTKIAALKDVEFVYLASHTREAGMIFKQAKELGIATRWLASNAIEAPDLFNVAGDAAEGVLYCVEGYNPNDDASRKFNAKYRQRYGRDSEMFAAHAYDAVRLFAKLTSQGKKDGEAIKEALYAVTDYPGVSGLTSFDKNGDVVKKIVIRTVRGRTFQDIPEADVKPR